MGKGREVREHLGGLSKQLPNSVVIAGLVPATPIAKARPCHMIGVAGTSPAMTFHEDRESFGLNQPELGAGVQELLRVDRFAVDAGLVVQMRPG